MAHHAQFKKSIRQDAKRNLRNRVAKSRLRSFIKKVRTATTKADGEVALKSAIPVIDSTARKGIIKKETASRTKSKLMKFVGTLS